MKPEIAALLQLCAAAMCSPAEAAQLDRAFDRCRTAPSIVACLEQQVVTRDRDQVTPSGVTIKRGK